MRLRNALLVLAAAAQEPPQPPQESDPQALVLVDRMWEAMGGKKAYDELAVLQFKFVVKVQDRFIAARSHVWDRKGERARIELTSAKGNLAVLLDLKSEAGVALLDGAKVPEEDHDPVVRYARGLWHTDVSWLATPWRLKDPGVRVTFDEQVAPPVPPDGEEAAGFRIKVEGAGPHPGDVYWFTIDAPSGRPATWEYRMHDMLADQETLKFAWDGWETHGGVAFATERRGLNNPQTVLLEEFVVPESLDPALFEALAAVSPPSGG